MSCKDENIYRRAEGADAQQAAVVLAIQFGRWCDATANGKIPPEPDQATRVEGVDQVANAIGRIADHLGLWAEEQRRALIDLLCGMANMIGDQGAELEGVLHPLLHPDAGPRHAMVVRLQMSDECAGAVPACPACHAVEGHRPDCEVARLKH